MQTRHQMAAKEGTTTGRGLPPVHAVHPSISVRGSLQELREMGGRGVPGVFFSLSLSRGWSNPGPMDRARRRGASVAVDAYGLATSAPDLGYGPRNLKQHEDVEGISPVDMPHIPEWIWTGPPVTRCVMLPYCTVHNKG
jgi:hypothetical protein